MILTEKELDQYCEMTEHLKVLSFKLQNRGIQIFTKFETKCWSQDTINFEFYGDEVKMQLIDFEGDILNTLSVPKLCLTSDAALNDFLEEKKEEIKDKELKLQERLKQERYEAYRKLKEEFEK